MPINELSAAQAELLRRLTGRIAVEQIERLWIFPPHQGKIRETGLFVISTKAEDSGAKDTHALTTVRYTAESVKARLQVEESYSEEGWAPAERIDRVIAGVLARSGDEVSEPLEAEIGGSAERWQELLERFGIMLDQVSQ